MIGQLVSAWINVLTHPSVQTFDAQKPQASRERTTTNIVIAAIVAAVLSALLAIVASAIFGSIAQSLGAPATVVDSAPVAAAKALLSTLVNTVLGFIVFCYVLQFVAERFFGGRGNPDEQAYLFSTYWAPVNILIPILMFIPCLGQLIALALVIYALVLTTFAVQSGQGVSVGSAIISWLISGVVTGIVMGILGLITGGWL